METNMYDTEFAKEFKEEIELDEMKWAVGGVYHQEFKNGDKAYFRADSVQKNKRWKGMQVDEFGGRQKKAKNATANENLPGWVTTPKNEIPKGLKEEVEIDEGKFKKGDIVIPNMGPHKGDKHKIIHDFGDGSYNIKPVMHPRNIKYKLGAAKAKENQLKLVKEEVELDEKGTAYPATVDTLRKIVKDKQHQTVMFKSGKAIVDLFTASAMVQVYDALKKPDMKKTFEKMITDKAGFMKTQAFAMKMIGK
jgi:hypothetical protein